MRDAGTEARPAGRRARAVAVDPAPEVDRAAVTPSTAEDLLVLQGIHKRWGAAPLLEGVDLSVPRGTVVSLTGANGSGKTTLLRIAAGLIQPAGGTVALEGLSPERDRRAFLSRIGFLSAGDRSLYARLSARQHLDLSARLALIPSSRRGPAVGRAVETFRLAEFADRRADRLSMGQRQRVRLAMTFVHDPSVLLLDEPANSLDEDGLEVLSAYIDERRSHGGAALWCAPAGLPPLLACDVELRLGEGRLQSL